MILNAFGRNVGAITLFRRDQSSTRLPVRSLGGLAVCRSCSGVASPQADPMLVASGHAS